MEPKRLLSHKISIYLRAPWNPGKVRVFCALVPSFVVEAWILVGYVWNLVGEVQSLVALQTVWSSIGTSVYSTTVQEGVWKFGERMYSVLNHLEPTWTSLNLSWNNACACEQLGNHFKFVGTDLWTIEPIGTYRNQVGTNLEPNGTSLCMEELGDGFSFVFPQQQKLWGLQP